MKKIIKALLLSAMVIGAAVGCDQKTSSSISSSSEISSIASSDRSSEVPSSIVSSSSISSSVAPTVTGYELDTTNVKKAYETGEALDLTGLAVVIKYSDNTTTKVTEGFTTDIANGTILNEKGNKTITVTYQGETLTFVISVKTVKRAWNEEETNIMVTNLHGVVLPFTGLEESVVYFDDETKSVMIVGGAATSASLASYANLIKADGFISINSSAYVFEKSVETKQGTRYVRVGFTSNSGSFYLQAYDPYFYSFPTSTIAEMVGAGFASTVVPPAIDATFYEVSDSNFAVYCYTNAADVLNTYKTLLTEANWEIDAEADKDGYWTATSPDYKYVIKFKYNTSYRSFDIYFGAMSYWSKKVVEDFFKKYNGYAVDIPAFNVANAGYLFVESDINERAFEMELYEAIHAFMYIYGATTNDLPTYENILKQAGWEVYLEGSTYYAYLTIPNQGIARIEFTFNTKANAIEVEFYLKLDPIPEIDWPSNKIAELLGEYTIDSIPEFTAANKGFVVLNDMFGYAVLVKVERGKESEAVAHYEEVLEQAKYVKNDETYYSPNMEIAISIKVAERGSVTIEFAKTGLITVFPVQFIGKFYNSTDTVPTLDNANYYTFKVVGERDTTITCAFDSANAVNDAKAMYAILLGQANYTSSVQNTYVSPSKDLAITLSTNEKELVISFTGEPKSDFVSLWPEMQIARLLSQKGFTDELPSYDGVCDDITAGLDYYNNIYVMIETTNKSGILNEYCKLLSNAGFNYDYATSDQYTYTFNSPNKQYSVSVSTNSLGVALEIKAIKSSSQGGSDTFPMEELASYFPSAETLLPIIESGTATFESEYNEYDSYYSIKVIYPDEDTASEAFDAYVQALKDASYESRIIWGGYTTIYYSPDDKFIVWPQGSYLEDGEFFIDVYDINTSYFPARD